MFLYLFNLLFSLTELKRTFIKHPLKEHSCKFKIEKLTYSKYIVEQRIALPKMGLQLLQLQCIRKITNLVYVDQGLNKREIQLNLCKYFPF